MHDTVKPANKNTGIIAAAIVPHAPQLLSMPEGQRLRDEA